MPNYYNQYPVYQPNVYQNPVVQQQPMQIQNGGFVSVRSETEARNYPVALGNSVTFKDENAPYIYTKTMGFSQLDAPKFDKYKLVKETPVNQPKLLQEDALDDSTIYNTVDELKNEVKALWSEIEGIKHDRKPENTTKGNSRHSKNGDTRHDEQHE